MNEQEMQFADPDWKPAGPQPVPQANETTSTPLLDPMDGYQAYDASQGAGASSYGQGYQGSRQRQYSSVPQAIRQTPGQQAGSAPRRRSAWWIWVIVIVLLLPMIGSMSHSFNSGRGYNGPAYQQPQPPVSSYYLGGISQLAITDFSGGSLIVQVGSDTGEVTVQTDDGSRPDFNATGSNLAIDTNDSGNVLVTIPQDAALSLNINADGIAVNDFSGQLSAQSDAGTITLNNDTLSGQSTITSNSGNITFNDTMLSNQATVRTGEGGNIAFSGMLTPSGNYQFTTDSGDITLNLPDNTSMRVQPSPGTGHYQNDFSNPTGNGPEADVAVTTGSGTITIHKGFSQ